MTVRVTGRLRAVKMALDEVLVRMDVAYQRPQRSSNENQHAYVYLWCSSRGGVRTISFRLTGAFNESAISCAFSLTLILRDRTVCMASLRLFCRPCLPPLALPFAQELHCIALAFFFAGHLSLECNPCGSPFGKGLGDGPRDMSCSSSSSKGVFMYSCDTSGNLKLPLAFATELERRRCSSPPVAGSAMFAKYLNISLSYRSIA